MNKRLRISILFLTVMALLIFGAYIMRNADGILGFTVISGEEARQVLNDNPPLNMLYSKMFFHGEPVPYDKDTNTFYIFHPGNGRCDGKLSFGSYAYSGFWVSDEPEALASFGKHELLISDGSGASLCNVEICGTPLLYITLDSYRMDETADELLRYINEKCDYRLFSFDEAQGRTWVQRGTAHLKERGALSRTQDKKGYKFTLVDDKLQPDKRNFFGLRNDDDWILNPLSTDIDKTHEIVAYKMWAKIDEADPSFSARSSDGKYVEVCINNSYRGLYLLQSRVDAKQTGLDRNKDILYKSNSHILPSDEDIENSEYADRAGTVEISYASMNPPYEKWKAIERYRDLAFMNRDEPPTMSWSEAELIVNMPNIIDFFLFRQAIHAEDNSIKNVFFLADGSHGGRITKIPWDMNYSFGDGYSTNSGIWTKYRADWGEKWSWEDIIRALLVIDERETAKYLKQRWDLHSDDALRPDNVRTLMLSAFNEIWNSGAFRRNAVRWPEHEPDYTYEEWMERFEVIWDAYGRKWQLIDDRIKQFVTDNGL